MGVTLQLRKASIILCRGGLSKLQSSLPMREMTSSPRSPKPLELLKIFFEKELAKVRDAV
jgi:hypothetical protein